MRRWLERLGLALRLRRPIWQQRLAERGLDPVALRALSQHSELAVAWGTCERIDWAVELAARAPVEPAVLLEGLECVAETLRAWGIRGWEVPRPEVDVDVWAPGLLGYVDRHPDVQAALLDVQRATNRRNHATFIRASDTYDEAYATVHRELTDAFRSGVPLTALRVVLEERKAHPYR